MPIVALQVMRVLGSHISLAWSILGKNNSGSKLPKMFIFCDTCHILGRIYWDLVAFSDQACSRSFMNMNDFFQIKKLEYLLS